MKLKSLTAQIVIGAILLNSCNKKVSTVQPEAISSVTLVNAVIGSNPFIVSFAPDSPVNTIYNTTPQVGFQSWNEYSLPSGPTPVFIYQTTDTSQSLFSSTLNFFPSGIYSLFLSGQLNLQNLPDTLLVQDNPPYHPLTDSSVGIRFVNLSPGSTPVTVDIMGNAPGSEVNSLAYRGITGFKSYPVTSTVPDQSTGYIFEFRSATSDSLLATFQYYYGNISLFKNVTVAFCGSADPNASSPLGTFLVNNY